MEQIDNLATLVSQSNLKVGNKVLNSAGTHPLSAISVLQTDANGALTGDTSIKLATVTDPSFSSAGQVLLYAVDVAGSTAVFARFSSGASQQIAIQQ